VIERLQKILGSDASNRERESALAPLLDAFHEPLLRFARQKLRQANRPLGIEAEDLVQEAWAQLIARLQKACLQKESVGFFRDDEHALNFLYRVVLTRFLDARDRQPADRVYELDAPFGSEVGSQYGGDDAEATGIDRLVAPSTSRAESALFFAHEGTRERLLQSLFESEEAFRAACLEPPRRRARQYQAMVLYYLVQMIQETMGIIDPEEAASTVMRLGMLIGLPDSVQMALVPIVQTVQMTQTESSQAILQQINALCGTKIDNVQNFGKMRHEINQLWNS
jgi:DNA-directed RNA polymerase specialized sigma24 family protein